MASANPSELELFHDFLGRQLASGEAGQSVGVAVERFRQYQRETADLRTKLRAAEEQSARGEVGPFDAEATKQALRQRLAAEGLVN